jgi:dTDP-4-dehydrorhamnose 3,5-epimerase
MSRTASLGATLPVLVDGVTLLALEGHRDERGTLTEVYRLHWPSAIDAVQWNLVESQARVLRGVHVHHRHEDWLVVVAGTMVVGLRDLRAGSPSHGVVDLVTLGGGERRALRIPPGVAHGFYFPEPSVHVYAVSDYWDPADELGCRFDDPDLGIDWPDPEPVLSDRDHSLPRLAELLARQRFDAGR